MDDLGLDDDLSMSNFDSETVGGPGADEDPHKQLSLAQQSVSINGPLTESLEPKKIGNNKKN